MIVLGLCLSVVALSACNTMAGAGKDIKAGGQHLENAADKHTSSG